MRSRVYGAAPYRVAVIHGDPGAPGSAAPVARELSAERGVVEPFQSASSVDGQTTELARQLEEEANPPVTLIGHSWGAWLSVLVAAHHPRLVAKIVLVGSGPFEATYAERIMPARMARLTTEEQCEARALLDLLNGADGAGDDVVLARFGELMNRAETFDPLPVAHAGEPLPPPHGDGAIQQAIYRGVWPEARELRASARLLDVTGRVRCPVVAVHGDHDPSPADGVRVPLARALTDFRFVLLPRCGHEPWRERHARDAFYAVLREELASAPVS